MSHNNLWQWKGLNRLVIKPLRDMTSTFFAAQEGSSKSLHLDLNRDDDQVVVASNTVFRIYKIEDNRFVERLNLRGTKSVNLNYSCNDVCWSKHDSNVIATAATNGAVVLWNLARPKKQEHVLRLGNHRDSLINSSEKLIHKS